MTLDQRRQEAYNTGIRAFFRSSTSNNDDPRGITTGFLRSKIVRTIVLESDGWEVHVSELRNSQIYVFESVTSTAFGETTTQWQRNFTVGEDNLTKFIQEFCGRYQYCRTCFLEEEYTGEKRANAQWHDITRFGPRDSGYTCYITQVERMKEFLSSIFKGDLSLQFCGDMTKSNKRYREEDENKCTDGLLPSLTERRLKFMTPSSRPLLIPEAVLVCIEPTCDDAAFHGVIIRRCNIDGNTVSVLNTFTDEGDGYIVKRTEALCPLKTMLAPLWNEVQSELFVRFYVPRYRGQTHVNRSDNFDDLDKMVEQYFDMIKDGFAFTQ